MKSNYYINSFFWSTLAKVLNAILGFISIPLLLGLYGKAEYGILSIATACNGYMHLLDLGMNTGAIKFFSQWIAEGKMDVIDKVARTNISFYLLIGCINIVGLITLALWGENLFSITHLQFLQLRTCLFIIALFSVFSWITTVFNQLLVSNKQIAFTMQMQCLQTVLKMLLIFVVLWFNLSLSIYFFFLTFILASLLIPYAYKSYRSNLISSFFPANYWLDFKIVITFSLSIFALSLFQMTATQSRPILLSMFAPNAASVVAEFRIIEVIPMFIIMVGLTFSSIFLPKASELVTRKVHMEIENFAYRWTRLTSILANILCIPFVLSSKDILAAYVGDEYSSLSVWLSIWCITALIQIHTTPGNSLILACGKTKLLVLTSAVACLISMLINIAFCKYIGVGSAVIGYFVYVLIVISMNYIAYYRKILCLNNLKIALSFIIPTIIGFIVLCIIYIFPLEKLRVEIFSVRINLIVFCLTKALIWLSVYVGALVAFKQIEIKELCRK